MDKLERIFALQAAFDQDLISNGQYRAKIYDGLPSDFDISQDEAVCIAYAWIEQKYGLSEDDFRAFFPVVGFHMNIDDDSFGLWSIEFQVLDPDDYPIYGWYHVYIHSRDGVIVQSNDVTTAKG